MVDLNLKIPDNFLESEKRSGYVVTEEIKKLWAVQLDLLTEFDRVCRKNKIEYMACAGTMLGAVRHHGFIPWDDDIDLMMTWENYKKLCEIGSQEFSYPYFFQNDYTDRGSARGHVQIRNCKTTAIRSQEYKYKYPFNQGIFIDVFCLDHIPDNINERNRFFKDIRSSRIHSIKMAKYTYRYTAAVRSSSRLFIRVFKDIRCWILKKLYLEERAYNRFEQVIHKYNNIQTREMGIVCILQLGKRYCWERKDIECQLCYVPFEFLKIPIPVNYEKILDKTYGDWKTFSVGTSNHGELIIDSDKSYLHYLE